jgi:hypothetical protein
MLMPNPLAPGFAGVAWWECERNPLHTAGRSYGPADPRQGQADFVSTKNQCEYAALKIDQPTHRRSTIDVEGEDCDEENSRGKKRPRRGCALIELQHEKQVQFY